MMVTLVSSFRIFTKLTLVPVLILPSSWKRDGGEVTALMFGNKVNNVQFSTTGNDLLT